MLVALGWSLDSPSPRAALEHLLVVLSEHHNQDFSTIGNHALLCVELASWEPKSRPPPPPPPPANPMSPAQTLLMLCVNLCLASCQVSSGGDRSGGAARIVDVVRRGRATIHRAACPVRAVQSLACRPRRVRTQSAKPHLRRRPRGLSMGSCCAPTRDRCEALMIELVRRSHSQKQSK